MISVILSFDVSCIAEYGYWIVLAARLSGHLHSVNQQPPNLEPTLVTSMDFLLLLPILTLSLQVSSVAHVNLNLQNLLGKEC